ncbi:MAG TPA: AEC family transporter [Alphaproteobacteria bacterium]|nr:AEC family transporter [Alphaproteobacteria bacterium]
MLSQLSAVILPVLLIAGIGFTWAKMGRRFDSVFLTDIATNIGTPCLVAHSLTTLKVAPEDIAQMFGAALCAIAGFCILGLVTLKLLRLSLNSYLPALMFPNTGNMGLPLALFAFHEAGLALAVVYFGCTVTLQFTLGISISAGNLSLSRLVRTPTIYSVAISILMLVFDIPVPTWIENTIGVLGGLTIPMMLLTLGVSIAQLKVNALGRNLFLACVRLGGGFLIALAVTRIFDLPPVAAGVLIIQSSMPVAVFNFLFAQYYGRAHGDVAAMVVISTALSFLTLPLLALFVLQ